MGGSRESGTRSSLHREAVSDAPALPVPRQRPSGYHAIKKIASGVYIEAGGGPSLGAPDGASLPYEGEDGSAGRLQACPTTMRLGLFHLFGVGARRMVHVEPPESATLSRPDDSRIVGQPVDALLPTDFDPGEIHEILGPEASGPVQQSIGQKICYLA